MLTAEDLLAAGFKEFTDSFTRADRCFQKRVWTDSMANLYKEPDDNQTAYFINVYYYQFPNGSVSYELDMSFDRDSKSFSYCWIKYHIDDEATVKDVESMAEAIFIANGGVPYGA